MTECAKFMKYMPIKKKMSLITFLQHITLKLELKKQNTYTGDTTKS